MEEKKDILIYTKEDLVDMPHNELEDLVVELIGRCKCYKDWWLSEYEDRNNLSDLVDSFNTLIKNNILTIQPKK